MLFTFIVIAYNEEQYILEALESIHYQIAQYGDNRSYQLILVDDYSVDSTRELMDCWIEKYGELFEGITCIYHDCNMGTCKSVADALAEIKGEFFYVVAGDDLLASTDVAGLVMKYSEIDIITSVSPILIDYTIQKDIKHYWDMLSASLYTTDYVKWAVGLGCPIQVGAAWSKRLNTRDVLLYMGNYNLLEDRTRFYAAYKSNERVSYMFLCKPLLIHRKNIPSVSNLSGKYVEVLNQDLKDFYNSVVSDSSSGLYKAYARIQSVSARKRGKGIIKCLRFITPYYAVELSVRIVNVFKLRKLFVDYSKNYLDAEQSYYNQIQSRASVIAKEYKETKI